MPNNMTNQQLQEWYARFAKELLEKVSIDVTRKEDVGRVKNYAIEEWGSLEVEQEYERAKIAEPTYAFMKHEGTKCVTERPKNVNYSDHKKWLMDNLQTDITIDHIRNLYDMSRAGTLMVTAPGSGAALMQQVYTDENGVISTSKPVFNMSRDSVEARKHGKANWAGMPKFVPVPRREDFTKPEEPVAPVQPKNMNPGWLSKLGWMLGFNTDYKKLVDYTAAFRIYQQQKQQWNELDPDADYQEALDRRTQFETEMAEYRTKPEAILQGVSGGYEVRVLGFMDEDRQVAKEADNYRDIMIQEDKDLKDEHENTSYGKMEKSMNEIKKQQLNISKRTAKAVYMMLSMDHAENAFADWILGGVFKDADVDHSLKNLEPRLPEWPNAPKKPIEEFTPEELEQRIAWRNDMYALSGLASFAALFDTAKENFNQIVSSLITVGKPNSKDMLKDLSPARIMGANATVAYVKGDATQICKLLSNGLRQLNRELAGRIDLNDQHKLGCLFLVDHIMNTLETKKDILDNLDLSAKELEKVNQNRGLFKVAYCGKEARTALMEHATQKKALSPEQLKAAVVDILFADWIATTAAAGTIPNVENPKEVEEVKQSLYGIYDVDKITRMTAEDIARVGQSMIEFNKEFPLHSAEPKTNKVNENQLEVPKIEKEELTASKLNMK